MKSRTARTDAPKTGRRKASAAGGKGPGRGREASGAGKRGVRGRVNRDARWSADVTRNSNAMDLEAGVFKLDTSRAIAASLKASSEASRRRKADPFRSAMSMLNFYINRAGKNLPEARRAKLEGAKRELRKLFGK